MITKDYALFYGLHSLFTNNIRMDFHNIFIKICNIKIFIKICKTYTIFFTLNVKKIGFKIAGLIP